jgi:hypothetical protein
LTVLSGSIRITTSSSDGTTFEIRVPGRMASGRRVSRSLIQVSLVGATPE